MAGIYDGQQPAANAETTEAILTGQGHAYYGLVGVFGVGVVLVLGLGGAHMAILGLLVVVLAVGILVDLYVNGYTH